MAGSNMRWYAGLLKPTFAPAPWIAGLASVALACVTALAVFRILSSPDYLPDRRGAIRLLALALGLDALWSWLFFAGRHPSVALAAVAILAVASVLAAWRFATVDRRAGLLFLPWTLATVFAVLLDLSIALRNG